MAGLIWDSSQRADSLILLLDPYAAPNANYKQVRKSVLDPVFGIECQSTRAYIRAARQPGGREAKQEIITWIWSGWQSWYCGATEMQDWQIAS